MASLSRLRLIPGIPVVILTSLDDEVFALDAVREGAQDYVVKGSMDGRMLWRAVRHAIERKRAREALRESESRYRQLLASVTDYIYTVKISDGRAVSTLHGPGCLNVTGYTSGEYANDPNLWYRMVHEEDRAAVLQRAARIIAGDAAHWNIVLFIRTAPSAGSETHRSPTGMSMEMLLPMTPWFPTSRSGNAPKKHCAPQSLS